MAPRLQESLRVTVIGVNARTVDSLHRYLTDAGVESSAMRQLPDVTALSNLGDALVLFPDDFDACAVLSAVASVQRLRPELQLLLITSAPQQYQCRESSNDAPLPILLPKPAFGWSILDAIREAVSRHVVPS